MAQVLMVTQGPGPRTAAAIGSYICATGFASGYSTESLAQITYSSAGTLSNLYIKISANTWVSSPTADCTFVVRINASNGNEGVSFADGVTGELEDTDSDAVAADDEVCYGWQIPAGAGSQTITAFGILFAATSNTVCRLATAYPSTSLADNGLNLYYPIAGWRGGSTGQSNGTQANVQFEINSSCTAQNLQTNVDINTRTTATVVAFEINGAAANQSISYAAAQTGVQIDTGTDALVSGNLVNYLLAMGADANNFRLNQVSVEISSTNGTWYCVNGTGVLTPTGIAKLLTRYWSLGGGQIALPVEDDFQVDANLAFTASNLYAYVSANTLTGGATVDLNHDGATFIILWHLKT